MKKNKLILTLSFLAAITLMFTGCGKKAELKDGAEVAVSVKGGKITATEYYEEIKNDNIATLIDMIDHKLLDKTYQTDDEENKAVKNQISQMKKKYGSNEETYLNILRQYFGVNSEKELEEMLRLEYKRNRAVKDYISTHLTDKEIKDYYNDNIYGDIRASHILISVDASDNATTEEKEKAEKKALEQAKDIIKQLDEGKDFATLAKKYSTDESNKEKGGDLGYFQPSDMVDEFSEAVRNLKDGEYTKKPVKTKFGYHIILRVDQKEKESLDSLKDSIKEKLASQKISDDNSVYYESLVKFRESKELKWNDTELEKSYNDYMNNLIKQSKSK